MESAVEATRIGAADYDKPFHIPELRGKLERVSGCWKSIAKTGSSRTARTRPGLAACLGNFPRCMACPLIEKSAT